MITERGEQLRETVHALLLANRVLRCDAHRIAAVGMNDGCRVADAAVALEELSAFHFFRQRARELRKLRQREIGEITASPWRLGCEDAQSHECRGADGSVIGTRYRVADSGIDAVESVTRRDRDVPLDCAGLTIQLQQTVLLAADAG